MEQLDFLDLIWGSAEGYVQFAQKRKDDAGNRTGDPTDTKAFLWPAERERIGRWINLDDKLEDTLYFAVPLYNKSARQQVNLKAISAVYVDDDGVTGQYAVEPSIRVESSPGHFHNYWVLSESTDPNRALHVGFNISAKHRHDNEFHADMRPDHKFCGTDPGGWDSTQILRIPGSVNNKPEYLEYSEDGKGHRVTWHDSGARYTIEELEAAYPNNADDQYVSAFTLDELPKELPNLEELLSQLGHRQDVIALYMETPTGQGSSSGWDERLFALENALFRMGYRAPEVFVIARSAACNKFARGIRQSDGTFKPRPNPDMDLWRDVYKAEQTHVMRADTHMAVDYNPNLATFDIQAPTDPDALATPVLTKPPAFSMNVLTDEEIERSYQHRTFVDRYLEWATSKTDAAVVFHIASAFTILSLVFGEFGHAAVKYGKVRLNLWFMVMGKTTRSRKSTSRGLMLKLLDGIQTSKFRYDEGSDFTGEGLTNALLEKPKRSSLIHRDEVQGLFKEIGSKNYMSGLNDKLTELYDGWVGGKKRATGGSDVQNTDRVETNFVLFMMGIVTKITDVLTLEDFQSGFLARFIHVIGEPPAKTRETEWLDQAPINEVVHGDPLYLQLCNELMSKRTEWGNKVQDFTTVSIRFEDDAWKRWNDANWDMQQAIIEHERAEILEAALDRMSKSAMKAACLIAMAEGRDKVNMDDVLVSLRYAQDWAVDMVRTSEMVSDSFWKKDLNTLCDLIIAKGGEARWEDIYAKMDKRPNEFAQLVQGMVESGRGLSAVDPSSKTRWLKVTL